MVECDDGDESENGSTRPCLMLFVQTHCQIARSLKRIFGSRVSAKDVSADRDISNGCDLFMSSLQKPWW
jgi:hypothetical protein